MKNLTTIDVLLDETAKDNHLFHNKNSIEINKSELFKYAIMMWEVPSHIKESDFDYLQSKVPALESLLSDSIEFSDHSIINLSNDDRVKKLVSEAVGIGIGLKYSVELLKTNPNKIKKIGVPQEGKYLDYSTIVDEKEYEIETKGTVNDSYGSMKKDILEKKSNPSHKKVFLRFGTITLLKNNNKNKTSSKCVIVDDPPEDIKPNKDETFLTQLWSYATFLSYILDSKYYNKYVKPLKQRRIRRIKINSRKFFGTYSISNKLYLGECFDYRLIKNTPMIKDDINLNTENLNIKRKSITKFFIGLDESVINAINKRDYTFLNNFTSNTFFIEEKNITKFLDKDGILIIKSTDKADVQLENIFSEEEVQKRMNLHDKFIKGLSHQCGAPCRSKEKKGKPCEIWTFREHCHFHR
jgi:hypothetical protein